MAKMKRLAEVVAPETIYTVGGQKESGEWTSTLEYLAEVSDIRDGKIIAVYKLVKVGKYNSNPSVQ